MIVGMASFILCALGVWGIINWVSNLGKNDSNTPDVLKELGKIGVGALAAKEAYDILTGNNGKRGMENIDENRYSETPFAQRP